MRMFISLMISLSFYLPMTVSADNPQKKMLEKRTLIKTKGVKTKDDADEHHLTTVLEWVESEHLDQENTELENIEHENTEVYVTVDNDQGVIVNKNGAVMPKGFHKITSEKGIAHAVAFTDSIRPPHHQKPMSSEAANCILKNISKINSDAAAHLLKQACKALNPIAPKSEQ
ncbi:MAG: hypothetical protein ACI9VI_000176 [Candidatus Azotimanducaceae bacterium]|jgi:hypothetical protein